MLSLLGRIDELSGQNKKLLEQVSTLLARIAELEARAGKPPKTPTNSALPPSSGQKANTSKSGRKKKNAAKAAPVLRASSVRTPT